MSNIIVNEQYLVAPVSKPKLTNKAIIISSILAGMTIEEQNNTLVAVSNQKTANGTKPVIKLMGEQCEYTSDVQQVFNDMQSICVSSGNNLVSSTTQLTPEQQKDSFPLQIDAEKAKNCPSAYVGYNLGGAIVAQKDVRMNPLQFREYEKNIKLQVAKFENLAPKYGYSPDTISDIKNSLASIMTINAPKFYNQQAKSQDDAPVMQRKN